MPAMAIATTTAVQAMGTGISRRVGAALLALGALIAGGCGGSSHPNARQAGAFSWLRPAGPPAGWRVVSIPSGASFAIPPTWERISGDRGTATAAQLGDHGAFLGYLNLTPRQGDERLSNFGSFRVGHNAEEGDRGVKMLAATTARRLGDQRYSCVKDSYGTTTGAHYIELACLVTGSRTSVVVVGASPPASWSRVSPVLERAINGVTA